MKIIGRLKRWFLSLVLFLSILVLLLTISKDAENQGTTLNSSTVPHLVLNLPKTKQNIPFHFFDHRNIYSVKTETVSLQTAEDLELIDNAKRYAANYLHTGVRDFKYGQYRLLGEGIEFDMYFGSAGNRDNKRVGLFYPIGQPRDIFEHTPTNVPETINIILPLKGRTKVLETFADNLIRHIYPADDRISLTVVYFRDESQHKAKAILQKKFAHMRHFNWTLLRSGHSKFSRGQALQIGANYVARRPTDLLFFCDVDIIIRSDFLGRCRTNTIFSRQVYYPIVFSMYNPSLDYGSHLITSMLTRNLAVHRDNGFWRHFGYGMVCLYKGDLDSVGGIPDIKSWGGEDEALFDKLSRRDNIKYIRSPDPSIFHIYHPKDCRNVSRSAKEACLRSKVLNEGSQLVLGLALFKLREDIDVDVILNHMTDEFLYIAMLVVLGLSLFLNLFLVTCIFWFFGNISTLKSKHIDVANLQPSLAIN